MPVLDPDHYLSLDAVAQAAGLRAGEFSTSDLVGAAIARAEQVNPGLNVFSSQRFTEASNEASRNDADAESLQRSPLAGLLFWSRISVPWRDSLAKKAAVYTRDT